jgi:DNA-binding NarL/FixJ family response regulator
LNAITSDLCVGASVRGCEAGHDVLIVDHGTWLADLCASVARQSRALSRVVVATSADEALRCAGRDWFRVFVNPSVPGAQGLSLVRALAGLGLAKRTCIVTAVDDRHVFSEARKLGVIGYVSTSMAVTEFIAALGRIMDGTPVLPEIAYGEPWPRLSERQLAVLRLLQAGMSSKQIAHELYIAEGTAKNHTLALLRMLGATNRAHAVARAIELGLLSPR